MFLITRWSKTWVINFRREDLMKKEARPTWTSTAEMGWSFWCYTIHESSEEAFRLVYGMLSIPTICPIHNPPHPLIPNRQTPIYRASPTQEPGSSVVVIILVNNGYADKFILQHTILSNKLTNNTMCIANKCIISRPYYCKRYTGMDN